MLNSFFLISIQSMVQAKTTHFGFNTVNWDEKQQKVGEVFHSVANKYDLMNDLMSFGIHRFWKHFTVELGRVRQGHKILDLAGGTGDLTRKFSKKIGKDGQIFLADINYSMLAVGRNRLLDNGLIDNIKYIQANAQNLPFKNNYFNLITIAFGLRNVTDKLKALKSMYDVCKPGGKIMVLEFSKPKVLGFETIYDWYSFNVLPKIGKVITNDESSYKYLAESIRMHPAQQELKTMIEDAGFEDCYFYNLTGGIVALHIAYKY